MQDTKKKSSAAKESAVSHVDQQPATSQDSSQPVQKEVNSSWMLKLEPV